MSIVVATVAPPRFEGSRPSNTAWLGANLFAAEAAADAAAAFRRAGETRHAVAQERRVHDLASRCQGARTPALATAGHVRVALTARELEIARLAAEGASNRAIAQRLYLSVHTVENKLHATYEKLGITGRADLASALQGDVKPGGVRGR